MTHAALLLGLYAGLGVCFLPAVGPANANPSCEIIARNATIELPIVPPGNSGFRVRVRATEARARPLLDQVTVDSTLRFETSGALQLPLHLSRALRLPNGLGYVGTDATLQLAVSQSTLRATVPLRRMSLGPIDLPCTSLTLAAAEEAEKGGSSKRSVQKDSEASDPQLARLDALLDTAQGIWIARVPTVRVYAAARDDAPSVELHAANPRDLRLHGLGSEGVFVHAGVRDGSVAVVGYVKASDVEPEPPPLGGGGLGGIGSRCDEEVEEPSDFSGEVTVGAGTRIFAAPAVGPWAELSKTVRLPVRWRVGTAVDGKEWVRIASVPNIEEVMGGFRFGPACRKPLRHAFIPLSAVAIPDAAGIIHRASASKAVPIGKAAVLAARKELGLTDSGVLSVYGDLGCFIRKGHVRCFGEIPGLPASDAAVEIPELADAVQVVTAHSSICALREQGEVVCRGIRSKQSPQKWTPLANIGDGVTLSAGTNLLCAVRADGRVVCIDLQGKVTELEGIGDGVAVSVGTNHACVLRQRGAVACFGDNSYGQLGSGDRRKYTGVVEVKGLSQVVQIAAGRSHTCATRSDGTMWCFGGNDNDQLGTGKSEYSVPTPTEVKARNLRRIVAGEGFTCGLSERGVACFGYNYLDQGMLAGGTSYRGEPTEIGGLSGARHLAMEGSRACAMLDSGSVRCWGARVVRTPISVTTLAGKRVRRLRAGYRSMCALIEDGSIRCWPKTGTTIEQDPSSGMVDFQVAAGQLCRLDAQGQDSCSFGGAPPGDGPASLIAVQTGISCAVRRGKLMCSSKDGTISIDPELQGEVIQVAVAYRRVCAVERSGRVLCAQVSRQNETPPPVRIVPGVLDAVEVAIASSTTCVRHRNGQVDCDTGKGPQRLESITDAVSVSLSEAQVCVVRSNGTMWCAKREFGFGGGHDGFQTPVPIPGMTNAVEVVVGEGTTCARRQDGTVCCFGKCDGGLCDGVVLPVTIPEQG